MIEEDLDTFFGGCPWEKRLKYIMNVLLRTSSTWEIHIIFEMKWVAEAALVKISASLIWESSTIKLEAPVVGDDMWKKNRCLGVLHGWSRIVIKLNKNLEDSWR